ncbi:MAG: SulP family inorganic anion transporter [SAR324 cluster bacterium]|nr:SulP family inorganic anion transporter [SAR324 cluster bacterium]
MIKYRSIIKQVLSISKPKIFDLLEEGYSRHNFKADFMAGLTVAIVSIPLSMGFAISAGLTPMQGVYSAVVGGVISAILGGCRHQISGPSAAFIIIIAETLHLYGNNGLLLIVMVTGIILILIGLFHLGDYIRFIPFPARYGITTGVAIVVCIAQIKNLLGLDFVSGGFSTNVAGKIMQIIAHLPETNIISLVMGISTIAGLVILKKIRPSWPNIILIIIIGGLVKFFFHLPLDTIGTKFGEISATLPIPSLPVLDWSLIWQTLPISFSFAVIVYSQTLISAIMVDESTGDRHDSKLEMISQGLANIIVASIGGMVLTGTASRSSANVNSGSHSPISGLLQAIFLLLFVLLAASLIEHIPLVSLSGVLVFVAWNMLTKQNLHKLLTAPRFDGVIFVMTILVMVFWGITNALIAGSLLGSFVFVGRMKSLTSSKHKMEGLKNFTAFKYDKKNDEYLSITPTTKSSILVCHLQGVLFFAAAKKVDEVFSYINKTQKAVIIDFAKVSVVDISIANLLYRVMFGFRKKGIKVIISGASSQVKTEIAHQDIKPAVNIYTKDVKEALDYLKQKLN